MKGFDCIWYICILSVNGSMEARRVDAHSSSSSADGQEMEEERRFIKDILSKITLPKVRYSCGLS